MKTSICIAVLHFAHETVTFLKSDTTVEDFVYKGSPAKGEELLAWEPKGSMGGFVKVAREYDGVELVGIESPYWPKTGTGSGWITEDAFERFVSRMIAELQTAAPVDGVYLCIHGAMGVRGVPRPEAELARRVRAAIGPKAPIAATFDPHGNEDDEFLRQADLAFAAKYFPHYDGYLQGERAARTLVRTIRGDYVPTHATVKVPILTPTVLQWTGASPWMDLVQRALIWEAREPDVYVNWFFGFPWADVPDLGMTVEVIANDKPELARRIADDMALAIWRRREALIASARVYTIAEGVALAKTAVADGRTPVVLADHSDRSGCATWLLSEIIAHGLSRTVVATLADRRITEQLLAQGIKAGDDFDMAVGGLVDESAGTAVRVQGRVLSVGEGFYKGLGQLWVNVAFGRGNVLVISPYLTQIMEPSWLLPLGLDPADFDIFALKSRVHFRRGFDDSGFAKTILLVEPPEPFLGTIRLEALDYRAIDRSQYYPYGDPIFPRPGRARGFEEGA